MPDFPLGFICQHPLQYNLFILVITHSF